MDRLLSRCGPTRRLGFFVMVPSSFASSSVPTLRKLMQGKHPASSFLAWSLTVPADRYALVAGSDYYQPRRYVRPDPGNNDGESADLLLLALLSPRARASPAFQLTGARQQQLLEAFASFKHEEARDSLGPPPADITRHVSVREKEKGAGAEEWWW